MIGVIRDYIWGPPLLILILGTGLYLTIILRGIQFRYLPYALKLAFTRHHQNEQGDISHFQSLMTALAGMIGIGSIAGVATALAAGGPGALFWMIVAALIGMATLYGESYLSVTYRIRDHRGEMVGGPMLSIRRGIGWRWLAALYGGGGAIAAITTGNMVQANAIADVVREVLPLERWLCGLFLALLIGIVLIGGIRAIGRVAGVLVPVMALFYCLGGLVILALHISSVPAAIGEIFVAAFTPQAPVGGFLGATVFMALRMGVSRGLFASEAGLGSSSIAAAAARTDHPGRQALINMTSAFLGVCIVCTITGLVISVTDALSTGLSGVSLTLVAFGRGKYIVIFGALLFGYSTLLGWAYYGERCTEYLFGERSIPIYRVIYVLAIIPGAWLGLDIVWGLADIANAFMAVPNLISLLMLGGTIASGTRVFLHQAGG